MLSSSLVLNYSEKTKQKKTIKEREITFKKKKNSEVGKRF